MRAVGGSTRATSSVEGELLAVGKKYQNLQGVGPTFAGWHQHTQFFGTLCQPLVVLTIADHGCDVYT